MVDQTKVRRATRLLLEAIGEDPEREGLKDTPNRIGRFWAEFIDYDPGKTETQFESITVDQLVVVSGMRVYSLCEHHLLPFYCDVTIGYLTGDTVLGLSKFARIAHQFAHRLQLQERLVHQIADEVTRITGSEHVAVVATGVHMCMVMRGIKTDGVMTSSEMRGSFRENQQSRLEFLTLAGLTPRG